MANRLLWCDITQSSYFLIWQSTDNIFYWWASPFVKFFSSNMSLSKVAVIYIFIFLCLPCCYCYEIFVWALQQDIVWLNIFWLENVDQSKCKCSERVNIFGTFKIWQNASRNQNVSSCRYLCMACYESCFICCKITQQTTQPNFRKLRALTPKFPGIYLQERLH